MNNNVFVVYVEQDEDGGYIGSIPSIPHCYAEGDTQEEMMSNLREVMKLCIRNNESTNINRFVGIQTINTENTYA